MLGTQANFPMHFNPQHQQHLFCPKHNEPIKGLCFFNGKCDERLLCRSCRRTHDSNHLNYYEELEDLKKDNLVRDLKYNLESMLGVITNQNDTYDNNSKYIISQINYFYKEIETNILQKLAQTREMLAENTSKKLDKNNLLKQELIASLDEMTKAYDRAIISQFNPPSTAEEMVQAICKAQVLRDRIESDPDLQYKETINFSMTRLATTISGSLFQQVKLSLDQIYQDIANSFALDIATNLPSVTKGKLLPTPGRRKSPYGKLIEEGIDVGQGSEEQALTPQKIRQIFQSVNMEEAKRSSKKKTNEKTNPMDLLPGSKDVEKAARLLMEFQNKKERSRSKGERRLIEYQNEVITNHKQIMIGGLTYVAGKQELVTAGTDGNIQVLDARNMGTLFSFPAHNTEIMRVMYIPEKDLLLSAGVDGKINVWDYKHKCKLLHSFARHKGVVYALEYLPETDLIISGGEDEYIRMWNVNTCREHHTMKTINFKIGSICRLEKAKKIAVGFDKGHINIIVIGQVKKTAYTIKAHKGFVTNLGYIEDQKLLVSGSEDGFIKIWKLSETKGECVRRFLHEGTIVRSFALFPEKDLIVGNYNDKRLRVWRISTGKKLDDCEDKTFGESVVAIYENDEVVTANLNHVKQWAINDANLLD